MFLRILLRCLKWLGIALGVLLLGGISAVFVLSDRVVKAPYPGLHASRVPDVIERGRYLANGPAHCVSCHGDPDSRESVRPLSGGLAFRLPLGTYFAPNLTPDPDTGIGRYSDSELARVLRHGVKPGGQAMLPIMEFNNLSDPDIVAVISYLRTLPAVHHEVPGHSLTLLGRAVHAFVFEPTRSTEPVRFARPVEATPAYGKYLATAVANCVGCHTNRDLRDGSFTGPYFAGGLEMEEAAGTFVTPNLTPHPTGRLAGWSEEDFVARFRAGGNPDSPMPWSAYRNMTETDLRALYRFLKTVPAAPQPTGD